MNYHNPPSKPNTLAELEVRAASLEQMRLATLADLLDLKLPANLKSAKGYLGQMLELYLGADASNKAEPDFAHLGVELKTIPLKLARNGTVLTPTESTYICTAPINGMELYWQQSRVRQKLAHVLWVPILVGATNNIMDRTILKPFFWRPSAAEEQILKTDWEELTNMLCMGEAEAVSANYGTYLQLRPKAANAKILVDTVNLTTNNAVKVVPKGFYLRSKFTQGIIANNMGAKAVASADAIDLHKEQRKSQ
jgi:DNA mismatch repair protein MutH